MTKEDYFKYYIQGSDHYLIPKDVFDELFNEMENWKEEAKELKKQLEETKTNYEQEKYIVDKQTRQLTDEYKNTEHQTNKVEELKNQQKEFIEYLEKTIVDSKAGSGQQYYYQQVLEMYKEIIGDDK